MTPRRPMALKPVARAAHALARPVFKRFGLSEGAIAENWAEIVGAEWARRASPRHFNRQSQTLTLRVAGAHALELAHLERELIARINGFAGRELVKRLKLVQGPVGATQPRTARPIPPPPLAGEVSRRDGGGIATAPPSPPSADLPRERGRNVAPQALTAIADENLAAALAALGRAIKSRGAP